MLTGINFANLASNAEIAQFVPTKSWTISSLKVKWNHSWAGLIESVLSDVTNDDIDSYPMQI